MLLTFKFERSITMSQPELVKLTTQLMKLRLNIGFQDSHEVTTVKSMYY
ncbi:hypothetical protein THF5H11_70161 [Vibrio jasicida]|nr:hypothetical protein THF5H11_70161 [Vibrio jasicida]CAH1605579.1 hypothetical protein THF5G08_150055 [Vibrio jasicida]